MTRTIVRVVAPVLFAAGLFAGSSPAQKPDQEKMVAQRDAKLKSEFLTKATWITDWDQAQAEAKKNKKLIFAYFTRSYAK